MPMFPIKHWGIFPNAKTYSEPCQISKIKVLYISPKMSSKIFLLRWNTFQN